MNILEFQICRLTADGYAILVINWFSLFAYFPIFAWTVDRLIVFPSHLRLDLKQQKIGFIVKTTMIMFSKGHGFSYYISYGNLKYPCPI